jgi:NAD(P)-dependent dehydrogenase (short-subunit alcohol dehydrogenase family)
MSSMKDKVIIVTGASSGIGRATALRFAKALATVVLVARSEDALHNLAGEITEAGGNAKVIACDLLEEASVERVIKETVDEYGGIDVVVNAAGIIQSGSVETTSLADWDRMMAINVRSPFYLMQLAMPHLEKRGGNVVNVSSVTGVRAFPGVVAYCTSKAAMDQLTHCVALEMAPKGVRINAVNPGVVVTNLHKAGGMDEDAYAAFLEHSKTTHPLGRAGEADEVASAIYFLASPDAGWITGVSMPIDGGRHQTCAR